MHHGRMKFYIDGAWVDPTTKKTCPVVNPATEEATYEIAVGSKADVDKAMAAARRANPPEGRSRAATRAAQSSYTRGSPLNGRQRDDAQKRRSHQVIGR